MSVPACRWWATLPSLQAAFMACKHFCKPLIRCQFFSRIESFCTRFVQLSQLFLSLFHLFHCKRLRSVFSNVAEFVWIMPTAMAIHHRISLVVLFGVRGPSRLVCHRFSVHIHGLFLGYLQRKLRVISQATVCPSLRQRPKCLILRWPYFLSVKAGLNKSCSATALRLVISHLLLI